MNTQPTQNEIQQNNETNTQNQLPQTGTSQQNTPTQPPAIYPEDVVEYIYSSKKKKKRRKKTLGIVERVGFYSDSSDSSDSEEEREELEKDEALVAWIGEDVDTSVERLSKLRVIDRSFLHGDIVVRANNPSGQHGMISNVNLILDLRVLDEEETIIKGVNSCNITSIHPFHHKTFAVYENWFARIEDVLFDIILEFEDGAQCVIRKADPDVLEPLGGDEDVPFFPGQIIELEEYEQRKLVKNAEWIKGKYNKRKHDSAIVVSVVPSEVLLEWITSSSLESEPPLEISIDKLQTFSHFTYSNWSVGDVCLCSENIKDMESEERSKPQALEDESKKFVCEIIKTTTILEVKWQDGTVEQNVKSTDLIPVLHVGDNDFCPCDFVSSKDDETKKIGVIQTVNAKQRTCKVKWLKDNTEEELSVYEIQSCPDFEYSLGDVVLLLSKENQQDDWIGEIIGMNTDGKLTVKWISGKTSYVTHDSVIHSNHLLTLLDEDSDEEDEVTEQQRENLDLAHQLINSIRERRRRERRESDEGDESTWETVSEEVSEGEEREETENVNTGDEILQNGTEDETNRNQIDEEGFERQIHQYVNDVIHNEEEEGVREGFYEYRMSGTEEYIEETPIDDESKPVIEEEKNESKLVIPEEIKKETLPINKEEDEIPKFEIVERVEDHHFKSKLGNQPSPQFVRIIRKEFKLLQENLPDGIFVKVYEERMDLLRAIIIGPKNTPYYDGIYIFDLYLPPEYPLKPPKVFFWSYGAKMNPNLYDNGNVCLSLLNTWDAKDECESWNPKKSNILQVLVSILGLVLNKEPYYNEAGYDKQIGTLEGEHNSSLYNESVLLHSVSHMIKCIENPPMYCKDIIMQHFKRKKEEILSRLKSYLDKKPLKKEGKYDENGIFTEPSDGFLKALAKLIEKLENSFNKI